MVPNPAAIGPVDFWSFDSYPNTFSIFFVASEELLAHDLGYQSGPDKKMSGIGNLNFLHGHV